MLRLIIANRLYSSWSLRGWLAAKLSGLPFETERLIFDTPEFAAAVAEGRLPAERVPVLWAGGNPVWESIAILEWLAEQPGAHAFWPADPAARAFARSIAAEMHGGFAALRRGCPMDLRRVPAGAELDDTALADVARIDRLWSEARSRFGGEGAFLLGAFGAADVMYAPVASRFHSYQLPCGAVSTAYVAAMLDHPWLREWTAAIGDEPELTENRL